MMGLAPRVGAVRHAVVRHDDHVHARVHVDQTQPVHEVLDVSVQVTKLLLHVLGQWAVLLRLLLEATLINLLA